MQQIQHCCSENTTLFNINILFKLENNHNHAKSLSETIHRNLEKADDFIKALGLPWRKNTNLQRKLSVVPHIKSLSFIATDWVYIHICVSFTAVSTPAVQILFFGDDCRCVWPCRVVFHNGRLLLHVGCGLWSCLGDSDFSWNVFPSSTTTSTTLPVRCRSTESIVRLIPAPCGVVLQEPVIPRRRSLWVSKWRVWRFCCTLTKILYYT